MAEATSDDVAVVLADLLSSAEQLLLDKRFGLEAAQGLMTTLWASHDRAGGASEENLISTVISKACLVAECYFASLQQEMPMYDVNQVRLFLCWALAAFSSTITVHLKGPGQLEFSFCGNGEDITQLFEQFSDLLENVISRCFCESAFNSYSRQVLDALLDFTSWIERKRPVVTLCFAYKIGRLENISRNMSHVVFGCEIEEFEYFSYRTGVQWCFCLLHLGFTEIASSTFVNLPKIKRSHMTSQMNVRHGLVYAHIFHREGKLREAKKIAKAALMQSEDEEEKTEIQKLFNQICEEIGNGQQELGPDEDWLEGTNVHQTEKCAVKQKEFQQSHAAKSRHKRPKRVQPAISEKQTISTIAEGNPFGSVNQRDQVKQAPGSTQNTSWVQNVSCTIRSNVWNRNYTRNTANNTNVNSVYNSASAESVLPEGSESEEDDSEDEGHVLEKKCFDFMKHDLVQEERLLDDEDWFGNANESSLILPSVTTDVEIQTWFQRSRQCRASAQDHCIQISEEQLQQYEQPGKRECRYTEFETYENLKKLLKDLPNKYKRCHLNVKSSHQATAKVLGKHDSCADIQIDGRSRIGRTFMDDEVVVELLAEPKKHQDQNETLSSLTKTTQASVDKHTHGKVIGRLKKKRFSDVKHPELFCTLDEHETYLMWPLCKTVPKIHVLHDGVKEKSPDEANNYVEIFQVTDDGCLEHRQLLRLNKSMMHQYVFRVVYITWRSNKSIYPLGAVLGYHFAGRDYAGGLELLAMQHRLPTFYPPDAVAQTDQLLLEENLPTEGREDLRAKRIFTIDPKGSRDLDDAISIWKAGTHFIVGVHITDVAAVVPQGEEVDLEARRRGVTFYPHLRKPHAMLPEDLGEKRCSLLPGQERLAFSFFFKFNQRGTQIGDPEVKRSLIKSWSQLNYADVQNILDGNQCTHISKELHGDIHQLHRITSRVKENRQKHSTFFVPFEDPRLPDLEQIADHIQAHSLIEELMILTNTFVAKRLRSKFPHEMILRCHTASSTEELIEWMEKEGNLSHLVMQLQGKQVTPNTCLSVENVNSKGQARKQDITVMKNVWKRLCRLLEDGQISEARRLVFMDGIHPLQHLAASHWMEMMEKAEYKCSHGLNGPDHRHFGLNRDVYTHLTSPMRRYTDLHVQRLLHNDLDGQAAYCTTDEVTELCAQLNNAHKRQQAFGKGCMALKIADDLQSQPLEFRAFVDTLDSEKMIVRVPSLNKLPDRKLDIPFSVLGVCSQPDFSTDTALKQDSVCLVWSKRHFDNRGTCPSGDLIPIWKHAGKKSESKAGLIDMTINPDQLTVPVNQKDWIRIMKALLSKEEKALNNVPEQAKKSRVEMEVDYVSSEKGDGTVCLRPVRYKKVYKRGQVLQLQLSAEPLKGVLKLQIELIMLAHNASICTKHMRNPVQALTAPATRTTRRQQFTSSGEYLQAWMPLIEMEAAAGAGDTDSAVTIDHVKVTMTTQREGYFCLSAKFCTDRCISIGGKSPDSIRAEDTKNKVLFPLDYLCLRSQQECPAPLVSRVHQSLLREAVDSHFTWLAHASVLAVTLKGSKSEDGAHLKVNFILSPSSPKPPDQLMDKDGARVTVEILTKSEVERRAQEMLLRLEEDGCELARSIAYGSDIPELDEEHYMLSQESKYHEVHMQSLPWNNIRQQEAIRQALSSSLSLIQGPPGTGKTFTGIKLIYLFTKINRQLMAEGEGKKSVLFCGPSNKSVDLVAKYLIYRLGKDCPKIVRAYSSAIETKDYPVPRGDLRSRRGMHDLKCDQELKHVSLHHLIREKGKKYADEIAKLEREFAKSLRNPEQFHVTNTQLKKYRTLLFKASVEELKHHEVILTTCAVAGSQRLIGGTQGRVFQVIIDECAMCSEPQAMIPIVATQAKQVVLIGDHKQLRPVITCQAAADLGLDQSLFERLFKRFGNNAVFLDKQYRMHPQLCAFPSREFYAGTLRTGHSYSWRVEPLSFWPPNLDYQSPNPNDLPVTENIMGDPANMAIPHLFVDVRGDEETLTVTTDEGNERSKSNALEIEKVIEILGFLKECFGVPTDFVRILTQYNAQRNELSKAITKKCDDRSQLVFTGYDKGLFGVTTVVSSQGGEWDYVILSTVRSLPSYKIEPHPTLGWNRQNLGFITDSNQVNVALTRARKGLFIVGNAELLRCDPVWKNLLNMYSNKGCVVSAEEFPPPPPARAHHPRRRNHHSASENWEEV